MHWKTIAALVTVGLLQLVMIAPAALSVGPDLPVALGDRYVPRPAGIEKDLTLFFGPFVVPPGQDRNLVTVDLPFHDGFVTKIAPNLVDAVSGDSPTDLEMHIHHAHWFRVSNDPSDEYYTLNLAWVFGTGEERTQGSFDSRAAADPEGPRYGIFMPGGQPQAMIFMLHNKGTAEKTMYITLETTFVSGTRDAIRSATDCGPLLLEREICSAGSDFHDLKGRLWGATFDVPRDFNPLADGIYTYPADKAASDLAEWERNQLGAFFTAPYDGIAVASAGHMHPNGQQVVVANLGPEGSGCEADLDGDGFAGTTLYYSNKYNRIPEAGSWSEEYQMGATQFGWRAPIHAGDRITQFGVYENGAHASYEAMSYAGIYVDREQVPTPIPSTGCTLGAMRPTLLDDPLGDARTTIVNHGWDDHELPYCGFGSWPACDRPARTLTPGDVTDTIHMAAFAYVPGDQNVDLGTGVPRVVRGTPLTVVNEDVALGIRHTLTTCPWPCDGPYVANYPQPDGVMDTGNLGNLDYINGAFAVSEIPPFFYAGDDMMPMATLDTSELDAGMYSFYCRIHPTMRGFMEIVDSA